MWKLIRHRLRMPDTTIPLRELLQEGDAHLSDEERALLRDWHKRKRHVFGKSLHVRHVDTGSCNACEWELTTLLNPVYDVARLGIEFVASPRHADVLIVTGGLTRNLSQALMMTYEATAYPKAVLALGACACADGLIGRTYAQAGTIDAIAPVTVTVAGCPPRPQDILRGLVAITIQIEEMRRRDGHGAPAV